MKDPKLPSDVRQAVEKLIENDEDRKYNRRLINDLFNGDPPYTQAEVEAAGIETNVNFLDATRMAHDARTQINQAFLNQKTFFTVTIDNKEAAPHDRDNWSTTITKHINKLLKRSLSHHNRKREGFAQRVLHGIEVAFWPDPVTPLPENIPLQDILVPERASIDIDTWWYFAMVRDYSPGQLMRMAEADPDHWNMDAVKLLATEGKELGKRAMSHDDAEELGEDRKALSFYDDVEINDPIKVYDFFFKDDEGTWQRRIIPEVVPMEDKGPSAVKEEFIYENLEWADDIHHFLAVHYADGNSVAPFRFHTVRGLGFLLFAIGELMNRATSKFFDKLFEEFMQLYRIESGSVASRLQQLTLHNGGIIPDGLRPLTNSERFGMNPQVVAGGLQLGNQKLSESAQAFTRTPDLSSSKELTATEVQARLSSAGQLTQAMLTMAKLYENFEQREIARRFSSDTSDPLVKRFREACLKDNVPESVLDDFESWEITTEMALGSGMQQLELIAVTMAMQHFDRFNEDGQRQLLHKFSQVIFQSPEFAEQLVPIEGFKPIPDDLRLAQITMGALMDGAPVSPIEDVDQQAFIPGLFGSIQVLLQQQARKQPRDEDKIMGLAAALQFTRQQIQFVERDPNQRQRAKQLTDQWAQLNNAWQQLFQNLQQEAEAKAQEQSPEAREDALRTQMKAQLEQALAQLKIETQKALDELKVQTAARLAEVKVNQEKILSDERSRTPEPGTQ